MTVTVTGPLATPTNIVVTLQVGGSLLPNTTYYVRVVATNVSGYTDISDIHSVASFEASFLTTANNKKCIITWSAVLGASGYWVYVTTTSGVYSGISKIGVLGGYSTTSNSVTLDGSNLMTPVEQLFASSQTLYGALDKEAGNIRISFTGTTTLWDIYNAVIAAGYTGNCSYDGGVFGLIGNIYITGSVAGSLTEKNKIFLFISGGIRNSNPNCILTFGDYSSTHQLGYNGCLFYTLRRGIRFAGGSLNSYYYGCVFKDQGYNLISEPNVLCGDTYFLRDQLTTLVSGSIIYHTYSDSYGSSDIVATRYLVGGGVITNTIRSIIKNGYLFDYVGTNTQIITISDGVIYGASYDLRSGRSVDDGTIFLNCTFPVRSNGLPIISWDQTMYRGAKQFHFTLALKVVDSNGTPISGTTVIITDLFGVAVLGSPFTTNTTGDIYPNLYGYRAAYVGPTNTNSTFTWRSPHTIIISKSGYVTKVMKLTMDRKREEIVVLENRREV